MYDPSLGTFVQRDPVTYEGGINLYQYVNGSVITSVDPNGLQATPGITGDCHIWIFAGHFGEDAGDFVAQHNVSNPDIITGCGNYVGVVSCFSGIYEDIISDSGKIPGFPDMRRKALAADKAFKALTGAKNDAGALAKTLCTNRRKFADDGCPERYACGAENQRCDRVTITITCDAAMQKLLTEGIGPDGTKVLEPNDKTRELCGLTQTVDCLNGA